MFKTVALSPSCLVMCCSSICWLCLRVAPPPSLAWRQSYWSNISPTCWLHDATFNLLKVRQLSCAITVHVLRVCVHYFSMIFYHLIADSSCLTLYSCRDQSRNVAPILQNFFLAPPTVCGDSGCAPIWKPSCHVIIW